MLDFTPKPVYNIRKNKAVGVRKSEWLKLRARSNSSINSMSDMC